MTYTDDSPQTRAAKASGASRAADAAMRRDAARRRLRQLAEGRPLGHHESCECERCPCSGSGRVAIFDLSDPQQELTASGEGLVRDFVTGRMVPACPRPTNGYCVRCGGWFPITERGLLERHVRR